MRVFFKVPVLMRERKLGYVNAVLHFALKHPEAWSRTQGNPQDNYFAESRGCFSKVGRLNLHLGRCRLLLWLSRFFCLCRSRLL